MKDYSNRSASYKSIVDSGGKAFVIVDGLTKSEAQSIENQYLDLFRGKSGEGFNLINKNGSRKLPTPLTYERCSELFYLDLETFPFLRYRKTKLTGNNGSVVSTKAGELVRTKPPVKSKYSNISMGDCSVGLHRVVWVLYNKKDLEPHLVIDHIDSDPRNNHPSNLQALSQQDNVRKAAIRSSSGVRGVFLAKPHCWSYAAVWTIDRKQYCKTFSLQKYGEDLAFNLVCEHRLKMENLYYNQEKENKNV